MPDLIHEVKVEHTVEFAVGWGMIILRTVARVQCVGFKKFQLDDFLMPFAGITQTVLMVLAFFIQQSWTEAPSISSDDFPTNFQRTHEMELAAIFCYVWTLWKLKLCMLVFYARLTQGLSQWKIRVRIGYGLLAATFVAVLLSIFLGCRPFQRYWQEDVLWYLENRYCVVGDSRVVLATTVISDLVTDTYLISIPVPLLWKAKLSGRKKLALAVVFGGGFFIMASSVARWIMIELAPHTFAHYSLNWAIRGTFTAIVVDNAPIIYPLWIKTVKRVNSKTSSYSWSRSVSSNNQNRNLIPHGTRQTRQTNPVSSFFRPLSQRFGAGFGNDPGPDDPNLTHSNQDILVVKESTVETIIRDLERPEKLDSPVIQPPRSVYAASCSPSGSTPRPEHPLSRGRLSPL